MTRWVEPRVWVSGEIVTAAAFNSIGNNLEHLKERDRVHVWHSQDEEIKNDRWEILSWDSERFDNNDMHTTRRRRNRLIEIQRDGIYLLLAKITFASNNTGVRGVMVRKNGGNDPGSGVLQGRWWKPSVSGGFDSTVQVRRFARYERGDDLRVFAYQDSGDKLDVNYGNDTTWFQVLQVASF